jgi:TolB-like protein/Tfp pilus assembly protein PilF
MTSLVPGYKYDIFISYRQKDNKGDRWVSEFVEALKTELESTFKEEISVYFDINPHDGLLETHDVDASLKEKLKCLIFVPIISRTYCDPKSFAWEHEFKAFVEQASQDHFGLKVKLPNGNVASRVLPIRIHDLDGTDIKECETIVGGVLRGVEFIYKEPGVDRPLTTKDNEEKNLNKTNYRNQINKVALAIREIITSITQYSPQNEEVEKEVFKPAFVQHKNRKIRIFAVSIIALILTILGFFFIPKLFKSSEQVEKSIAVLPFRNLSNDSTQLYFCDGFTEEILNNLQKIQSFTVRSRTSTDQYRDTKKSITAIGNELNVNYLVEGSVGREGNNIKIWVQLIDTKADKHLWSNDYTREMTIEQIFSLQSEIAKSIAAEMKAVLTPGEIEKIEKKPTENIEAYNLYLQGNYYFWKSYDSQDYEEAIQLYEKVIELDSGFALAYTRLAMSYLKQYWFYHNRNEEVLQKCRELIDKAFDIDPQLPEAHLALGMYYYMGYLDYPRALEQLEMAIKEQPGNSEALYYIGCVYRRAGNWEMSKSFFVNASKLAPKSAIIAFNTAETFDLIRNYSEALQYYNTTLSINPDWTYPYKDLAELYMKIDGNTIRARELLDDETRKNAYFFRDSLILEILVLINIYDNNYEEALKNLSQSRFDIFEAQWYYRPKYLYYAFIYGLMNKPELEHAYYDSTRMLIEKKIIDFPQDQRLYSSLGIAYAGLGYEEKAIISSEKALRMLPVREEAYKGVYLVENLAYTYVLLGKYHEAIKQIEYLLSIPGPLSCKILELDPRWAPLKQHPEFEKILEKYTVN